MPKLIHYPPTIQKHFKKAQLSIAKKLAFASLKDVIQNKKAQNIAAKTILTLQESSSSVSEQISEESHLKEAKYDEDEAPSLESPMSNTHSEKSYNYLSSFWRVNFDWDERFISDSLKLLKSDS